MTILPCIPEKSRLFRNGCRNSQTSGMEGPQNLMRCCLMTDVNEADIRYGCVPRAYEYAGQADG